MIAGLFPPVVRLGQVTEANCSASAKLCLQLARNYGSVLVAVDEFGIAYAAWPDGRHGRKILRDGVHYVVGTFAPTYWSLDKRDPEFSRRVSDALLSAVDWQKAAAREIARELAA